MDVKVYHHHTPRYYLLPWADADERIVWLGYGKILRSKLTVVGGENDFYRLRDLTDQDIIGIRDVISTFHEYGREGHEFLLNALTLPSRVRRILEQTGNKDPEKHAIVEAAMANLNEDYHTAIENGFWPFLDQLRAGQTDFYEDHDKVIPFLLGLSVQYFRTKRMKERIVARVTKPFVDIDRAYNILGHMLAVSMGGTLFVDRKDFRIVLLTNDTVVPFITSDQPIINIHATDSPDAPERFELFYPLSPTKAMLYLEKSTPLPVSTAVSIDEAHAYNLRIAGHAAHQIFSDSEEYLKHLQSCIKA